LTATCRYDTLAAMSLIRGLFWFCLFVFFAFCFVVLFEHGTSDFSNGFKVEFNKAKTYVMEIANSPKKKDEKGKK